LKFQSDDEFDRAQSDAKAAFHRAKRIVRESRALLLNQKQAVERDVARADLPPPMTE